MRLLLVEDTDSDIEACLSTVKRYNKQKEYKIDCVVKKTKNEALSALDSSFDGAIIDLKLSVGSDSTEGNDVIADIHNKRRIPLIILTGTPQDAQSECSYLGCFKKGEIDYGEIFDKFYEIYKTGLTKIMGGRGIIEDAMQEIFWGHLLPHLDTWKKYSSEGKETEKAILRLVLNHLLELLGNDENLSHPEEMYIFPPIQKGFKTGSIVKQKVGNGLCIVLNPACDLVLRAAGQMKTDRLLLVEIDDESKGYKHILEKLAGDDEKKQILNRFFSNNFSPFYHWLPATSFFPGGFINFRKLSTMSLKQCLKDYDPPHTQVSSHFVKDILSRFSSYYSRQGQPDIDCANSIDRILAVSRIAE